MWAALHSGVVCEGFAPHYAQGLMARVSANRDMPPVACMVSSAEHEVGAWLWIYGIRTDVLLHCRVTDVSHPRDRARHRRTKRLIELDYAVTHALCGSVNEPSASCPVVIVRL